VISICIFFTVFLGALLWMLSLKRPYLNSMRELPLEEERRSPDAANPPRAEADL